MKRMKKAILLPIRRFAYRWKRRRLYYWANRKLFELRSVCVMPRCYYHWLYPTCLRIVEFKQFRRLTDWAIHTIPYHVRFTLA